MTAPTPLPLKQDSPQPLLMVPLCNLSPKNPHQEGAPKVQSIFPLLKCFLLTRILSIALNPHSKKENKKLPTSHASKTTSGALFVPPGVPGKKNQLLYKHWAQKCGFLSGCLKISLGFTELACSSWAPQTSHLVQGTFFQGHFAFINQRKHKPDHLTLYFIFELSQWGNFSEGPNCKILSCNHFRRRA